MKATFLLMAILVSGLASAQVDIYQYNQKTGVSEKVGYTTTRQENPIFAPYRGINVDLYGKALQEKQRNYEANLAEINKIVVGVSDVVLAMYNIDEENASILAADFIKIMDAVDNARYDWSNGEVFYSVRSLLLTFDARVRREYANALYYK
jgi:hypothetical protein